jgi:hypothetical protein
MMQHGCRNPQIQVAQPHPTLESALTLRLGVRLNCEIKRNLYDAPVKSDSEQYTKCGPLIILKCKIHGMVFDNSN